MGADGAVPVKKPLFAKPSLDAMGPGTDMPTPAGAVSRSLFRSSRRRRRMVPTSAFRARPPSRCSRRTRWTR
ncbi:hypothetical protein AJ88_25340 [Mesorhizobium amorphae CCBAU 01583]|nr:hypothetical protein AJ88_25340 [Mesorhizobium amorphae CCBAU 01583]